MMATVDKRMGDFADEHKVRAAALVEELEQRDKIIQSLKESNLITLGRHAKSEQKVKMLDRLVQLFTVKEKERMKEEETAKEKQKMKKEKAKKDKKEKGS